MYPSRPTATDRIVADSFAEWGIARPATKAMRLRVRCNVGLAFFSADGRRGRPLSPGTTIDTGADYSIVAPEVLTEAGLDAEPFVGGELRVRGAASFYCPRTDVPMFLAEIVIGGVAARSAVAVSPHAHGLMLGLHDLYAFRTYLEVDWVESRFEVKGKGGATPSASPSAGGHD